MKTCKFVKMKNPRIAGLNVNKELKHHGLVKTVYACKKCGVLQILLAKTENEADFIERECQNECE